MESDFDVLSTQVFVQIIAWTLVLCAFVIPIFRYLGHRHAFLPYKKGIVCKIVQWILACVLMFDIGKFGYLFLHYPWLDEPQPSPASMYRQLETTAQSPLFGFANDQQLAILTALAAVVLGICWTTYAFSYKPSPTSWWKKACKFVAYLLLSVTILGFRVHTGADVVVYGGIALVALLLLRVARVHPPKDDDERAEMKESDAPVAVVAKSNAPTRQLDETSRHPEEAVNGSSRKQEAPSAPADSSRMYCKYCGKSIKRNAAYCRYCGHKL